MNECEEDAKRERAARHLLDSRLADFLPLVIDGFARHARQRTVAEAFRDLATYVLPQIYRKDFLLEIRRRLNSGNFLEIPASHKSIVELLVAGAQGHKLSFDRAWQYEGDVPAGKFEIAPSAELGVLDAKKIQKFVEGFERAIMTKIGGLAGQFRDQTRAINKVLAKRRAGEFGKPPTRYYYLYPDGHGRIDELELRYPHVIFICHEKTDFDDDEFDILHCLQEMFCTDPESDP